MELIFLKETKSGKYIPVLILIVLKYSLMQSPFVPNNNHPKKKKAKRCLPFSRQTHLHTYAL